MKLFTNQTFLAFLGILIGLFACMSQVYAPEIRCATVGDCSGRAALATSTPFALISPTFAITQVTNTPIAPTATVFRTPTNARPTFPPFQTRTSAPTITPLPPTLTPSPTVTWTPIIIILPTQTRTLTATLTITATTTPTRAATP
jgi:hypothetical protein